MNGLLSRVFSKLYRIGFSHCYRWSFQQLGLGATLFRPFRIDGGNGISLGEKTIIQRGAWLYCCGVDGRSATLAIGTGCVLGYNNHIAAVGKVVIGDCVLTANNVYISDNIHGYEDISTPVMYQPVFFKKAVFIGDGCWIGENVSIIGARIGKNCVIGANAVVTHDIPDYSVAVGIPAVVIRQFDPHSQKWVNIKNE